MMNARREEDKNEDQIKKLSMKHDELVSNMNEVERRYSKVVEQAKDKGVVINNNPEHVKKWEELKKKVDNGKQHKTKTDSLYKTKSELVVHEQDQIRQQIRMMEVSIQKESEKCEMSQAETGKTIERAKLQGKVSAEMMASIEQLVTEMEGRVTSLSSIRDIKEKEVRPKETIKSK